VLHKAVSQRCLGCKNQGTLKWNSALRSDFCNLICDQCTSVYTLCCVSDSQRDHKLFDKGTHFRGSYAHFHQLKKQTGQSNGKMLLVFATRSLFQGQPCSKAPGLPVYVAQIRGALPNLNSGSFSPERIRIKSSLVFDPLNSCRPWYSVSVPHDVDIVGFSMKVFHTYFDSLKEKEEVEDGKTDAQVTGEVNESNQRQISSLEKIIDQVKSIKGKQERGVDLEKWELDLLGREQKVLAKLEGLADSK